MKAILSTLVGLIVLLVVPGVVWRYASRRWSLPCPPGMAWALENWYVDAVASSESILDSLDLRAGMRVLDLGCGPGRVSLPAAKRVAPDGEVVALDIQQAMLDRLQEETKKRGIDNVRPLRAGAGNHKLEGPFDRAVMAFVLGEIPNRQAALQEVFEVMKPGGVLAVVEVLPDPHYQSQKTVRRLAGEAGFEVDKVTSGALGFTMLLRRPERRPSGGEAHAG